LEQNIGLILQEKVLVMQQLEQLDFVQKVFPSDSNFVLFRVQDHAMELYKFMADHGVVTRFRGNEVHCENCIRVTIGKPEENQLFLQRLVDTWKLVHS
jgi:histidinol-phosphate aminotransferase